MRRERVVELLGTAAQGKRRRFGSGYLLDGRHVLTARHVTAGSTEEFQVRPLGSESWVAARLVWVGQDCDAALLELADPIKGVFTRARLGRIAGTTSVPCGGVGFPRAQADEQPQQIVYDTEQIEGRIQPLTAAKRAQLSIKVDSGAPKETAPRSSPWQGSSGAAVFSGALLVGVLRADPTAFGPERLEATPITAVASEQGFRQRVMEPDGPPIVLEAVEGQGVLEAPYEQRPLDLPPEASSFLLGARYGVVPFRARDELTQFGAWCASEPRLSLALLTGPGGAGKTRVGAELCRWLGEREEEEWVSGFLAARPTRETTDDWARALAGLHAPLLVVVDYAETRREDVVLLLERLADQGDESYPARVLLLARAEGDWWRQLAQDASNERVRRALGATALRTLEGGRGGIEQRQAEFEHALRTFAGLLRVEPAVGEMQELSQPLFERVLFVHMAALSTLDRESEPEEREHPIRESLLAEALAREGRYWSKSARDSGLSIGDHIRRRAIALATLTTPASEAETASLLTVVPDLSDERARRHEVARWLHDLYPAKNSWAGPLEPDALGEALVSEVVDALPTLVTELLSIAGHRAAHRALTVLTRVASNHPESGQALVTAFNQHLESLWPLAVQVAQETGDPIGVILAESLAEHPNSDLAETIAAAMPQRTVALRELAAVAAQKTVQRLGATVGDDEGHPLLPNLAEALHELSNRLADLGHDEDALAAIQQAVSIHQALMKANPDNLSLSNVQSMHALSNRLLAVGRDDDALATIQPTVDLYRGLIEGDRETFLPNFAGSLNNLSGCLARVGRDEDALGAIEEAIRHYRELTETHSDAFLPNLATSLQNLSSRLTRLTRYEDALGAIDEAVRHYRELSQTRPDAFIPNLADAHRQRSTALINLDRADEAVNAAAESLQLYMNLFEKRWRPFMPEVAATFETLAHSLAATERPEEALTAIEAAVGLRRELAGGQHVFLPELASALNKLSAALAGLERREASLAAVEESVKLYRELPESRRRVWRNEYVVALNNLSAALAALGRDEESSVPAAEAAQLQAP